MRPLITPSEATEIISRSLIKSEIEVETISLEQACKQPRRILAEDLHADRDAPPFDRVMMDGICINTYNHALGSWRYQLIGTQAAGEKQMILPKGEFAIEVMTGAPLPEDANAVIPIEKIDITDGYALPHEGLEVDDLQYIHQQGSDTKQGDLVISKGTILTSAELATAASIGATRLQVYKQPNIHIITTGDEVISPEDTPTDFQIRRSHPSAITALLHDKHLTNLSHEHLQDDPMAIEKALTEALTHCDVLILTGGISMGKFDWVAPLLEKLLGQPAFHGVSQRPGKPFAYWEPSKNNSAPTPAIFALPGNPVSVIATIYRYVLPALMQQQGANNHSSSKHLPLATEFDWEIPLTGIIPYRLSQGTITLHPPKNSGDHLALIGIDGFAEIPPACTLNAGTLIPCFT